MSDTGNGKVNTLSIPDLIDHVELNYNGLEVPVICTLLTQTISIAEAHGVVLPDAVMFLTASLLTILSHRATPEEIERAGDASDDVINWMHAHIVPEGSPEHVAALVKMFGADAATAMVMAIRPDVLDDEDRT